MEHEYAQEHEDAKDAKAQLDDLSTRVENIYLAVDAQFDQMIHLM